MMRKIITFLFVLSAVFYFGQNTVDVVAKWNVNDVFPVQFTSEITDSRGSQKVFTKSIFDSKFTVNEVDDSHISVTWIYSAAKMDVKENNLENIIISKILNQPLQIKLSDTGKYDSLENTSEIKNLINKILENELAKTADDAKKAVLNIARNLVKTDEGVALLVTKNIKAYLFSFGYQFIENKSETHDLEISNPFGGENFLATETVEMTNVDEDLRICIIKTDKVGNGDQLKISVVEALKKASGKDAKKIDAEIGNAALEFSENTEHIIDYSKGIVNKGFFKRTMNFGFQNRVQLLKFSKLK